MRLPSTRLWTENDDVLLNKLSAARTQGEYLLFEVPSSLFPTALVTHDRTVQCLAEMIGDDGLREDRRGRWKCDMRFISVRPLRSSGKSSEKTRLTGLCTFTLERLRNMHMRFCSNPEQLSLELYAERVHDHLSRMRHHARNAAKRTMKRSA